MREGGELADILARLKQELGLGGGTLTLRGLSDVAAYGKGTVADDCIVNDGSENDGSEIEQG